jgi:hypothetical protein
MGLEALKSLMKNVGMDDEPALIGSATPFPQRSALVFRFDKH